MRRITAHLFHTLDGIVSSPNLWQFDQFDNGCGAAMASSLGSTTGMLLGRVAYTEWADHWPAHPDEPFGQFANPLEKFVASRTLTEPLTWHNSTLIEGDLFEFVRTLREGEGGDVTVVGISVIRQLFLAGLIDALTLTTHPVIAGEGVRLFPDGTPTTRLSLLDSSITEKGNAILTYGLRGTE